MAKLPAFQFYPGDWRKDPGVQSLDYFERGVWIELLCLMHESEHPGRLMLGGKPYPEDRLARLLGLSPEVMGKVISTLITLNVARVDPDTGVLFSNRMVKDREIGARRAKCGILGGNPNFKQGQPNPYYQKDNLTDNLEDKQKITPSSSSSLSSSDIESKRDRAPRFTPPTLPEISDYCRERGNQVDPEKFRAYYESNGWKVGRNPMKSWKAAITTWEKGSNHGINGKHPQPYKSAHERKEDRYREALGIGKPKGDNPPPANSVLSGLPPGGFLTGNNGHGN